ncbi:MAG: DUF3592 domain-containing protein [Actinomycetota bacterium]
MLYSDLVKIEARALKPADAADHPPAMIEPATAWLFERYHRTARAMVIGGCIIALVCVAFIFVVEIRQDALLRTGTKAEASVVSFRPSDGGSQALVVEFVADGRRQEATIVTDLLDYRIGEVLTIAYDPSDPSRARTLYESNWSDVVVSVLAVALFVTVVLLILGPIRIRQLRRWRSVLIVHPWRPVRYRYIDRLGNPPVIEVKHPDGRADVFAFFHFIVGQSNRLEEASPGDAMLAAGETKTPLIGLPPGPQVIHRLHRPRGRRTERLWRKAVEKADREPPA